MDAITIIVLIIIVHLRIVLTEPTTDETYPISLFDYPKVDFAKITKLEHFVDKSMLTKAVFQGSKAAIVNAPHKFGKSSNIDMLKKYFGIEVDDMSREVKDKLTTANYKIFQKLAIHKDEPVFFRETFGKYPVMHINYQPLRNATSTLLVETGFRVMIMKTFEEHEYLLKGITPAGEENINATEFFSYMQPNFTHLEDIDFLRRGFSFLAKALHKHFSKKVVVLIDDYDAFIDSLLFDPLQNNINITIALLKKLNHGILDADNDYIHNIFATGVYLAELGAANPIVNPKSYNFLDDHLFSPFFGLTETELNSNFLNTIKLKPDRDSVQNVIVSYFGGYEVPKVNLKIYNIHSAIEYYHEAFVVRGWTKHISDPLLYVNCWNYAKHEDFSRLLRIPPITEDVKKLLADEPFYLNTKKGISKNDITTMNFCRREMTHSPSMNEIFLRILYNLGYLKVVKHGGTGELDSVTMSNWNAKYKFSEEMTELFKKRFTIMPKHVQDLRSAVDSFTKKRNSTSNSKFFENFHRSLNMLIQESNYYSQSVSDLQSVLIMFLLKQFPMMKIIAGGCDDKGNCKNDLFLINSNDIGIVIKIAMTEIDNEDSPLHRLATEQHMNLSLTHKMLSQDNQYLAGEAFIAIAYQNSLRKISLAGSFSTEAEKNHKNIIVVN